MTSRYQIRKPKRSRRPDRRRLGLSLLVLLAILCSISPVEAAELGFYGWGPRLGVGDKPDQVLVGLHQDLGEFVDRVRLQISVELGFGDDRTIASVTLPVHYRFRVEQDFVPYLGGGLVLGFIDLDRDRGDDSEFEIAPVLVGGIEKPVRGGNDLLLELHLTPGDDLHDAKVIVGWMFRSK